MIWIKICGTTNLDDALASIVAGADALGFIFTESPRQIAPETAAEIITALPESTEKIGVVVNETPQALAELARQTGLTGFQLHGDEPASQLAEFRRALSGRKLIKTLQVRELLSEPSKLEGYLQQRENIDAILLDSGSATARGGTRVPFDWTAALPMVQQIKEIFPVIIGGGLARQMLQRPFGCLSRGESRSFPASRLRPERKTRLRSVPSLPPPGAHRRKKSILSKHLHAIGRAHYEFDFDSRT